jgi:hypothetical protein
LAEDAWISLMIRENALLPVRGDSRPHAGEQVLVLADREHRATLESTFTRPAAPSARRFNPTDSRPSRDGDPPNG